ncbi:hypothetical protein BDZ88DRAFT_455062 [Geranomyces variabilis]|nr:hypothetical protein BDZ88DRAFT_455062 [Geranomyces variabilis]
MLLFATCQIITYLTAHAHPELKKQERCERRSPILPQTVIDQIRLWEMERNRLRLSGAWLYSDFTDLHEFTQIVNYAEPLGAVLWKNEKRRTLAVTEEGHENVKSFRKRAAAARAGGAGR